MPCAPYAHVTPVIRLKTRALPLVIEGEMTGEGDWRVLRDDAEHLEMERWRGDTRLARLAA
ncbi:MAG: hypothetical protein B7X76_10745 [Azorhizobium sp. 39-67-5]|nr:MAG: hypothetical protein B7X76_10745 [Azorhizobium sp. 39-67-5]